MDAGSIHTARTKLNALKLLNASIIIRNKDFNLYTVEKVMPDLMELAKFGFVQGSVSSTTAELLNRGKFIFGRDESDTKTAS